MNSRLRKLMLPFYFGSLEENDRLLVERELLSDAEVLLEYLDLKRKIEAASAIDFVPSSNLWARLKPKVHQHKTAWISLSVGAAIAASLFLIFVFQPPSRVSEIQQPSVNRALFDSSSELPASSNVL